MKDVFEWLCIGMVIIAIVGGWWRVLDWVHDMIAAFRAGNQ